MSEVAFGTATVLQEVRARAWLVGWWAGGRVLVFGTALVLHAVGPRGLIGHEETTHLLGALGTWDGRWYRTVATNGYLLEPGRQSDPAFFPLYPMFLRALHATGIGYVTSGVILSNAMFLGALVAFELLTRELFGPRFAHRATVYLALIPMGFVFSMEYPESLVLFAISFAALAALRRRWLLVAVVTALATLARPEVLFSSLALLPLALQERESPARGLALGAALAPVAALTSFAVYLQLNLHDAFAWTHAERAWGRRFTPLGLYRAVEHLPSAFDGNAWVVRDVAFFVLYVALLWIGWRSGVPRAWIAAAVPIVVLPTFSGSFHSVGRFGLLAPALFWGLAAIGERLQVDRAIRILSAALLVGGTVSLAYVFP
jgi:hypothetical protein